VRPARAAGRPLVVGRAGDRLFALDGICPHAGAVLGEGMVDGDLLICPLHAFGFDVGTGYCEDDPGCSVRAHPVREIEGRVQVRLPAPPGPSGAAGSPPAASGATGSGS